MVCVSLVSKDFPIRGIAFTNNSRKSDFNILLIYLTKYFDIYFNKIGQNV